MGGSVSKTSLTKNAEGIQKLNQAIEKTMQSTMEKYSELIKGEMGEYYQNLISIIKEPGLSLPPPPQVNIAQVFGQKCNEDLVVIFEKKLNRFPKYALETSALFGTNLEPITMEMADADSIEKQSLCQKLSSLYASFLQLIEQSVIGLVACRTEMDGMMARLNTSIAESKANLDWFKKMNELQNAYTSQLKSVDKFLKKMDGITLLSEKQLNKLITDMQILTSESQSLPQKCSALARQLESIQIVDIYQAAECQRLNISETSCNANAIDTAITQLEQQQQLEAQQLAQKRSSLSPPTSAINNASMRQIGSGKYKKQKNKTKKKRY